MINIKNLKKKQKSRSSFPLESLSWIVLHNYLKYKTLNYLYEKKPMISGYWFEQHFLKCLQYYSIIPYQDNKVVSMLSSDLIILLFVILYVFIFLHLTIGIGTSLLLS